MLGLPVLEACVYVQCVAGSLTAAVDVLAVADADADALADADADGDAFGVPPPVNAMVRPAIRPITQATARPMPKR